jgi:hypothetical protein
MSIEPIVDVEVPTVELTKKGTIRKRKPKKSNNYFTQETEDAIVAWKNATTFEEKDRIFSTKIYQPFFKLTENIIHTFKYYYTEVDTIRELQHEVIIFLLEKMHMYNQAKGKAYSYFGTIAKRYLILSNQNIYKKIKNKAEVEEVDEDDTIYNDLVAQTDTTGPTEFMGMFITYMDHNLKKIFNKPKDIIVADAIIQLFRNRENIDIFNKKALYIYIREMTDSSTPQITRTIKKLKKIYKEQYNHYYTHGYVKTN